MQSDFRSLHGEDRTDEIARWAERYRRGETMQSICEDAQVSKATVRKLLTGVVEKRPPGRRKLHVGFTKAEAFRNWDLKTKYGLTLDQYKGMVAAQDGKCAICDRLPGGKRKNDRVLHVDHDHVTGKIRALLCYRCNLHIGAMEDSPTLLRKAADYLDKHQKNV